MSLSNKLNLIFVRFRWSEHLNSVSPDGSFPHGHSDLSTQLTLFRRPHSVPGGPVGQSGSLGRPRPPHHQQCHIRLQSAFPEPRPAVVRKRQILPPRHQEQQRYLRQQSETQQGVGRVLPQGGLFGRHFAVRGRRHGELKKGYTRLYHYNVKVVFARR